MDEGALARPGDADIGEPPLLLEPRAPLFVERALRGEQPFLPAGQEDDVELQPLGRMQRHDRDGVVAGLAIGIHDQRDVFEEAGHGVELLHGAHQLLQILQPPRRVGRAVGLPHLGVARLLQNDFRQLGVREMVELRPPAVEGGQQVAQRGARARRDLVGLDDLGGRGGQGNAARAGAGRGAASPSSRRCRGAAC